MSHPVVDGRRVGMVEVKLCRPDRYKYVGSYSSIGAEILKLISQGEKLKDPTRYTRCEIEGLLSKYTRASIAQSLLDLVEEGKVVPELARRLLLDGHVTVWRLVKQVYGGSPNENTGQS